MKHNIRQRVINQYGLPVTKVESVNGELGSGIFDKNGVEIFEGDIVKLRDDKTYPVIFAQGNFTIDSASLVLFEHACEVVGHVEEED